MPADDRPEAVSVSFNAELLAETVLAMAKASGCASVRLTIGDPKPYSGDEIARVAASLWQPFVIEKTWVDAQERARRGGALHDL